MHAVQQTTYRNPGADAVCALSELATRFQSYEEPSWSQSAAVAATHMQSKTHVITHLT